MTETYVQQYNLNASVVQHLTEAFSILDIHDPKDPHTGRTPQRFARYLQYLKEGELEEYRLTTFPNANPRIDHMVVVPNITFWSACAHHTLPFMGTISVGYIPDEQVIGLSKIPLHARAVARGFWLQEHLTHCIANDLMSALDPLGVAIQIRAQHTCQLLDVKQPPIPEMITTVLMGVFHPDSGLTGPRDEFFAAVRPGGRV